ncbi:MAG: hypothetical protein WC248_06855 [Candidatus Methanomethylophilaceae archaeon]
MKISEEWLVKQYTERKRPIHEIACMARCSKTTVCNLLQRYAIPSRGKPYPTWLHTPAMRERVARANRDRVAGARDRLSIKKKVLADGDTIGCQTRYTCAECGTHFVCTVISRRKYCSRRCYLAAVGRGKAQREALGHEYAKNRFRCNPESYAKKKIADRKWELRNMDKVRARKRRHMAKKRATLHGRIEQNMSHSINSALRGNSVGTSWQEKVGYGTKQLRAHIEGQFEDWMTWDNWGRASKQRKTWHIDHIIPKSLFSYTTHQDPEFQACWGLDNLRPLESSSNLVKSDKVDTRGLLEYLMATCNKCNTRVWTDPFKNK